VAVARSLSADNAIRYVLLILWIDVMFARNRPGKGDAKRACTQSNSPGSKPGRRLMCTRFPYNVV